MLETNGILFPIINMDEEYKFDGEEIMIIDKAHNKGFFYYMHSW